MFVCVFVCFVCLLFVMMSGSCCVTLLCLYVCVGDVVCVCFVCGVLCGAVWLVFVCLSCVCVCL